MYSPITLALGGGGARGLAHFGILEMLARAGVPTERVVGTSIGSFVGALYAFEPDVDRVTARVLDYLASDACRKYQGMLAQGGMLGGAIPKGGPRAWLAQARRVLHAGRWIRRLLTHPSLLPGQLMQDVVADLLPDADIRDAAIPLSIVALDLQSGREVVLERGPVRQAVMASTAIPGVFPPIVWEDMLLTDAGAIDALPLSAARTYGPACLLGVDVSPPTPPPEAYLSVLHVLARINEIGRERRDELLEGTLVVRPQVAGTKWYEFTAADQLLQAGRRAAADVLAQLPRQPATNRATHEPHDSVAVLAR
jgi:NTE family protein